jgi:hypothetical protein
MARQDEFESAQQRYAVLMRDRLAPALRELGLKGSGGTFVLDDPVCWAIVGFQRSVHNDRSRVQFTVNLTVVGRQAWAETRRSYPYLSARPAPNMRYGNPAWQQRIGTLLPSGVDTWWAVDSRTDLDGLAREVIAAIRDHGLPAMRRQLAATALQGADTDQPT